MFTDHGYCGAAPWNKKTPVRERTGGSLNSIGKRPFLEGQAAPATDSFFNRAARRDTLRAPVFLWTTPLETARINSD